jgi:hypothetical protein
MRVFLLVHLPSPPWPAGEGVAGRYAVAGTAAAVQAQIPPPPRPAREGSTADPNCTCKRRQLAILFDLAVVSAVVPSSGQGS